MKRFLRNEKGSVLLIAIVILVVLTFLGFYSLSTTNTEQSLAGNERVTNVNFNTAEAGAQDGFAKMVAYYPAIPPDFTATGGPLAGDYSVSYAYLNPVIVPGYSLEQYYGYEYEIYSTALSVSGVSTSPPLNEIILNVLWFIENPNPKE